MRTRVIELTKSYGLQGTAAQALRGVTLSIEEKEFVAIAGPSGSGKSTLLNLIGGLERPTSGSVELDDVNLSALTEDKLASLRSKMIGFVFQTFNLLSVLTAYENVELPLHLHVISAQERRVRVLALLEAVGLKTVMHHRPSQLSGGQRQRVAVARALVARPRLILADEPTANLDQTTGIEIIRLLKRLKSEFGTTLVLTTHDPRVLAEADRQIHLLDGTLTNA